MQNSRVLYLDYLRVFATLCVIIIHVAAQQFYTTDFNVNWQIANVYDSLCRFAVPIFVMISGVVFIKKDYSLHDVYTRKIPRILIALIFWSIFYYFFENSYHYNFFTDGHTLKETLRGWWHLWFLVMIIKVYMVFPIIQISLKNGTIRRYLILMAYICLIGINILSLADEVSYGWPKQTIAAIRGAFDFNILFSVQYVFYFIIGYHLSTVIYKNITALYYLGVFGFLATMLGTSIHSKILNQPNEFFYGNFSIPVICQSIFLFLIFKLKINTTRYDNIVVFLSKYCFGMYLVHIFFVILLSRYGIHTNSFSPIISIPVISISVFIISFCTSYILSRIPILKKVV